MNSPHIQTRSYWGKPYLVALKRFQDAEAIVLDVEPLMHNANKAERNALGNLERSSHQENMRPKDMVGSLKVRDIKTNVEFSIGSGLDATQRTEWWFDRSLIVGKVVKYKFQHYGTLNKPRTPIFLGVRDITDLDLPQAEQPRLL